VLLDAIRYGDPNAADELLPLIYDELRRLAAARLAQEPAGQTLQATALVHEAYLRLAGSEPSAGWSGRAHFFAAAAEAMRRILVDRARRKQALNRTGGERRVDIPEDRLVASESNEELFNVHAVLDELATVDPLACQLVKLRYFAGMTMADTAESLEIPQRTAQRLWTYAKAWRDRQLNPNEP
jgi:RNA polymerase sigma factor (TIGR02999 family)